MTAEIISIGTELLLGHIINTDTAFLSQKLSESGIDVYHTSVVGDNPRRLTEAVQRAAARSDVIITTGGLGPTIDDITIETISGLLGYKKIKWIRNIAGTASGIKADYRGRKIICLPGPPREIEPMFINEVVPILNKIGGPKWAFITRSIKMTGLAESLVNNKVAGLLKLKPPTTVGIYARLGQVELKIMSKARNYKIASAETGKIEKNIRAKLGDFIFGCDDETLEGVVGEMLAKKRLTISVAESCTGGLLANRITNINGSSRYFMMGLIAYSNTAKENILGISGKMLKKYGAVSREVAGKMAGKIKSIAGSDIGVGITGIAGPRGGSGKKPVGLVYVALAISAKRMVKRFCFKGSRKDKVSGLTSRARFNQKDLS